MKTQAALPLVAVVRTVGVADTGKQVQEDEDGECGTGGVR